MRSYLSSSERTKCAHLRLCGEAASDLIQNCSTSLTKEELKCLKFIRTYVNKWWGLLEDRLDDKDFNRLLRVFRDYKPTLVPRVTKPRHFPIDDDSVFDLLELVVAQECGNCTLSDTECTNCKLFQINQDLNISLVNDPTPQLCPYRYDINDLADTKEGDKKEK